MKQFDVLENIGRAKNEIPYLLNVQSDLLSEVINTVVVVPLYLKKYVPQPVLKLNVPVQIKGKNLIAAFDQIASFHKNNCGLKVDNIAEQKSYEFKNALDILLFNQP